MKERIILHCDLNNFYASVECELNPTLKDQALAVSGNPEKRHGVVLAKNEKAKKCGIKTGDTVWEARQKCPDIMFVPPHFDLYSKFSKQVFDIYSQYTCYVEPFGPDECWLDVTGSTKLFGSGEEIADKIRNHVKTQTGLTISVGVSFNKVFAKIGSDMKKPDAVTVITKENFRDKLWNLPVSDMLMVGRKTTAKLNKLNVKTIGDLARADDDMLDYHFGINGKKMKENALGLDDEPVREYVKSRKIESVGHGMTAVRNLVNYEDVNTMLCYLADLVATRLRKYGMKGYGIHLDLRSSALTHKSKQCKLPYATQTAGEIVPACMKMCKELWKEEYPLRTISISVFDLVFDTYAEQTSLFEKEDKKKERMEKRLMKLGESLVKIRLCLLICNAMILFMIRRTTRISCRLKDSGEAYTFL